MFIAKTTRKIIPDLFLSPSTLFIHYILGDLIDKDVTYKNIALAGLSASLVTGSIYMLLKVVKTN